VKILQAQKEHIKECMEALRESKLGKTYFASEDSLRSFITEGIDKKEIYAALGEGGQFLGYIWISLNGAFYKYPYCRNIAVKKEFRNQGVGKVLLKYYEKVGFINSPRIFILVSDFNQKAKKLYENMGFMEVGRIPDLFKDGVTEIIMIKYKTEKY